MSKLLLRSVGICLSDSAQFLDTILDRSVDFSACQSSKKPSVKETQMDLDTTSAT